MRRVAIWLAQYAFWVSLLILLVGVALFGSADMKAFRYMGF